MRGPHVLDLLDLPTLARNDLHRDRPEAVRTLRTNRETTPEGFHGEVLSDHTTRNREASQQVNDPQSPPSP
jgi:hypothetical protein